MAKTAHPRVSRVVLLVIGVVGGLAGPTATQPIAARAAMAAPPALEAIVYTVPPYARVGDQRPMLRVELDATATEDTTVQVQSSSSNVVVPPSVTVLAGSSTATVDVAAVSQGMVTISASLGPDTVSADPALEVREIDAPVAIESVAVVPDAVQPGQQSLATVVLDFTAPPGGTLVALSSSSARVQLPPDVTVPADADRASVIVTTSAGAPVTAVVTATLDGITREAMLSVADTRAPGTRITRSTIRHANRSATFRFASPDPTATFRCRLDSGAVRRCTSPRTYERLSRTRHVLRVWARDPSGNVDATPAVARFGIRRG